MPDGIYTHKPWRVAAVHWNGRNFPEVQQFFRDYVGPDKETGIWNEPDEGWPTEKFAYNTLQFYYGDDVEVDPDTWIVVHLDIPADQDIDHIRIQMLGDDEFKRTYDRAAPVESAAPPQEDPDDPSWVHGSRLGREHRSLVLHLVEDHGFSQTYLRTLSDGGVHGLHDGSHGAIWSYNKDLPHPAPNDPKHAAEHPGSDNLGYGKCTGCGEMWPCTTARARQAKQ